MARRYGITAGSRCSASALTTILLAAWQRRECPQQPRVETRVVRIGERPRDRTVGVDIEAGAREEAEERVDMRRAHRPRSGEGRAARIRVDEPRVLALQDHLEGGLAAP